VLTVALVN